jgi:hypothetical protein
MLNPQIFARRTSTARTKIFFSIYHQFEITPNNKNNQKNQIGRVSKRERVGKTEGRGLVGLANQRKRKKIVLQTKVLMIPLS